MNQLTLAVLTFIAPAAGLNEWLSQALNFISGRSWILDTLIALPLENDWIKAGVIGACFFAAWQERASWRDTQAARRTLLIALVAAVVSVGITKTLSKVVFLPRPYVQSQKTYVMQGDALNELPRASFRVPLDKADQESYRDLLGGDIPGNDLGSFPSDHASFFTALALGVWLASRRAGWIALAWTFLVVLASKMITGQHTPLDIAAGAGVGAAVQLGAQFVGRKLFGGLLDRAAWWTIERSALAGGLAFAVIFEFSSTLTHVIPLVKTAAEMGKHLLRH